MSCDQCQVTMINRIPCHEHNCPNNWKDPITDEPYKLNCTCCDTMFVPETEQEHFCGTCTCLLTGEKEYEVS